MTAKVCVLAICALRSPPQPFEAPACRSGVMDGVLGVTVAQVVLNDPQIVALVGKMKAAGVTQGMRMNAVQPGALGRRSDEVVDRLPSEWLAALGKEQPGQFASAPGEVTPDRAQLVAGDGLLDRQPTLEPAYPQ